MDAQEHEDLKEVTGHFIIKERWVISQGYADSVSRRESETRSGLNKSVPDVIPPTPPSIAVFDRKKNTHFLITPEKFVY